MWNKGAYRKGTIFHWRAKTITLSPWMILLILFCANTVFRTILAAFPKCIAIYNEEQWYYLLAENLANGRGFPVVYYGHYTIWRVVYSILIAPAFFVKNRDAQFFLIGLINSAILSSGLYPAYCIAKEYLSEKKHIWLIVVLYLLMPDMTYSISFSCDQPFLVICLWTIYFICRIISYSSNHHRYKVRDIFLLFFFLVIGLFTKRAIIIFGIAFLIMVVLQVMFNLIKNRRRGNLFLIAILILFVSFGGWFTIKFGFLQNISAFVTSSKLNLGNSISYYSSLFLFMVLSDVVALLFFPFVIPYLSVTILERKHRVLLFLMTVLMLTFAFLSVNTAFYRVIPYEVFLRYIPFLWIPYLVLFLSSIEAMIKARAQTSKGLMVSLAVLSVLVGVFYKGMGFWSNVDQTMLFWTMGWSKQRILYGGCFILVCLGMCFVLYKDRRLFLKLFLIIWGIIQLYNNVVAYQRFREEWEFSNTDIQEIEQYIKEHPDNIFCILDNDFYDDGRNDFSEARVADTYLNYPNVIRSSLVSVLQAENAVTAEHKALDLSDYQFPVYCWMSDEGYYPPTEVDYLFVPKNAICYVEPDDADRCEIGKAEWFDIYKLKDKAVLPEIHSARYYDSSPAEEISMDVHQGNFASTYSSFLSTEEQQNYVLYGPYISLPQGEYEITVHYSYNGESEGRIGYMDLNGSVIDPEEYKTIVYSDENYATIALSLTEPCDDFEVRLFAEIVGIEVKTVDIDLIALTKQSEIQGYILYQMLNCNHEVTHEEYYSADGEKVNNTVGFHAADYDYKNGDRIKSSFYDVNRMPVITSNGYSTIRYLYDEYDQLFREEYYGVNGEPVSLRGCQAIEYDRDSNGNIVEIRYYDDEGDRAVMSAGHAMIRRMYNDSHQIVREEYYDEDYKPLMRTDGFFAIEYRYDEAGNIIEHRCYDQEGELTLYSRGYAIRQKEYNDTWQVIRESYYDKEEKAVKCVEGYHSVEYRYDDAGNLTEYRFYDLDGDITTTSEGYAILQRVFNEHQQVICEEYYDVSDEPVEHTDGYYAIEYEYDDVNNTKACRYYGRNGELCLNKKGYAILRKEYSKSRQVISKCFYDTKDHPIECKEGYWSVEYSYDSKGHVVKESYYGLDHKLTETSDGYATIERTYDEHGKLLEEKAYAIDGTEVELPQSES